MEVMPRQAQRHIRRVPGLSGWARWSARCGNSLDRNLGTPEEILKHTLLSTHVSILGRQQINSKKATQITYNMNFKYRCANQYRNWFYKRMCTRSHNWQIHMAQYNGLAIVTGISPTQVCSFVGKGHCEGISEHRRKRAESEALSLQPLGRGLFKRDGWSWPFPAWNLL